VFFVRWSLLSRILATIVCASGLWAETAVDVAVPAGFNVGAAMTALFGNFDPKDGVSRYTIPPAIART